MVQFGLLILETLMKGILTWDMSRIYMGHYITNPNNALYFREISQTHHALAMFDPPKMGNLITPDMYNCIIYLLNTYIYINIFKPPT